MVSFRLPNQCHETKVMEWKGDRQRRVKSTVHGYEMAGKFLNFYYYLIFLVISGARAISELRAHESRIRKDPSIRPLNATFTSG
jgi:hypothetical protein